MTIVEMQRGKRPRKDPAIFPCDLPTWHLLLEIGKAFGWQPRGAPYVELVTFIKTAAKIAPLRHDYEPGSSSDAKRLDADDAFGWAHALTIARDSPHLSDMISATLATNVVDAQSSELSLAREQLIAKMNQFIDFLRGGEFSFSIRKDADELKALSLYAAN